MIGTIPLAMQWEQMAMPSGGRAASEKGASWAAGVVAALLAMSLSVAIIRTLTASSVTPRLQPTDPDASTASALPPVSVALDVSKLASMMGLPVVGQNSIRAKDGPSWGQSRTERGDAAAANRVGKMTGDESRPNRG